MHLSTLVLLAQLSLPARLSEPVLTFPEAGIDDPAAYQQYQTRFYRDAARNTVQIYIEGRTGRVVHLLANADNESIGFTARGAGGDPARLHWGEPDARVSRRGALQTLSYQLTAQDSHIHLGWFVLGSMRVERDFQYWGRHKEAFASPPFTLSETEGFFRALDLLEPAERARHLALLRSPDRATLQRRLRPFVTTRQTATSWAVRVRQASLDGRDSLVLEIAVDPRAVAAARAGDSISLRSRAGAGLALTVTLSSSAKSLTPLSRSEVFAPEFLAFLSTARDSSPLLERQVRGVELLSSREKLMAGLPAYATYFGRDMLVSSLMMRTIWRDEMAEFSIASVLRKLAPDGQVSHEEAMGGQAVREAMAFYARVINAAVAARERGDGTAAARALERARETLRDHRRTRENYHMVDDEFQFPILVARWLADPDVSAARKRDFLLNRSDLGEPRLNRMLRELALVARMTAPYAADQTATNLVSFAPRDSGRWSSASWRDSGVGYAGGRFAMDVNAIWVPHALESVATILATLPSLGISVDSLARSAPELAADAPLGRYARDPSALRRAADAWWGASRHFLVRYGAAEVRSRVAARLAALPEVERAHWTAVLARTGADQDSLAFLALALDAEGRPIGVANTDVATRLFLGDRPGSAVDTEALLRDVRIFTRAYPVGLLIDGVGPVVANDAYATPPVWSAFERDRYHGPRVVWGREVNLFLLGVAEQIARAPAGASYVPELRSAFQRVMSAAEASGFQSELWSYEVRDGGVTPVRYGTGSDVQLWSTTDLAVQYALWRLRGR